MSNCSMTIRLSLIDFVFLTIKDFSIIVLFPFESNHLAMSHVAKAK